MIRTRTFIAVSILGTLLTAGIAAQSTRPDVAFREAIETETVKGDLKGAIEQYKRIADGTDRALAAKALLRMAGIYERLGDPQTRGVYERLVGDFSDLPEAKTARDRRGSDAAKGSKLLRPVWTESGTNQAGPVSADGRYISFVDQDTGDLAVRDLVTGTNLSLTHNPDRTFREFAENSVISRDGARVAYVWWIDGGNKNTLRVAARAPGGASSPQVLLDNPEFGYVRPFDWSPKADWIAVQVKRPDGTAQIGVVTLANGEFRSLKSMDWRGTTSMSVSPDGAFIVYDMPASETSSERDVFVISRDGQRAEHKVNSRLARNVAVGWTPDGKSVLFATERSGTIGLSAVPMSSGIPQGPPQLIDPDLGTFDTSLGITRSGSLMFLKKTAGINVFTATMDFTTGALVTRPEQVTDSIVRDHPGVMWSPDGKSLAYVSAGRGGNTIVIRSLDTGQTREITPRTNQIQFPRWTASAFITFQGSDLKGRQGIFRVDVQTGETALLAGGDHEGYRSWADATPDGRQLVFGRNNGGTLTIFVRDLESGTERVLASGPATAKQVSPDGRMVAYRSGSAQSQSIMVVPIAGGQPRAVLTAPGLAHLVEWLPDSRHVVARKSGGLLVAPLDGSASVETALPADFLGPFFRIHPDGHRVAYSAGEPKYELWSLEHFLPATTTKK